MQCQHEDRKRHGPAAHGGQPGFWRDCPTAAGCWRGSRHARQGKMGECMVRSRPVAMLSWAEKLAKITKKSRTCIFFSLSLSLSWHLLSQAGNTALHMAVKSGHTTTVRLLMSYDCRVNVRNELGLTPIEIAHREGYNDIIGQLSGLQVKKKYKRKKF